MYKELKGKEATYYVMNPDPVFGSTAIVIERAGKGLLVDTQFSKHDADKIVALVRDRGIEIETIYISYSDPDYYFGTDQVKKAFPNARVLATASNIERIKDSYEAKLTVWADTLKDGAPDKIIIPEEVKDKVSLEGLDFEIYGADPKKQTLYERQDKILLGGILVAVGSHLFMADTKTIESQKAWIKDLDGLLSLEPETVIPGHFRVGADFSERNIKATRDYIEKFIKVEEESQTSQEIIDKMKEIYPSLPEGSLDMSAKVVTGEMKWD
ncbi:MBL fold metallo-hydrolase [Streptococcaceae bacterium ESL0687]|nr:MBL fold metallo-hydrolase [Streptococcaceae bacterium ESL0687]